MADDLDWSGVQAKALAYIAFHYSQLADKDLATKASFLEGLGVPREDAARMLSSTPDSIRVALATAAKGGGKNGKKGGKDKRK